MMADAGFFKQAVKPEMIFPLIPQKQKKQKHGEAKQYPTINNQSQFDHSNLAFCAISV